MKSIPSQSQMLLPLLQAVSDAGGEIRAADAYQAIAENMNVEDVSATVECGNAGSVRPFDRAVRWVRQKAMQIGLLESAGYGVWKITEIGKQKLIAARPGECFVVVKSDYGVGVWGRAEDAVKYLDDGEASLILTSPPYPLIRKKQYGNLDEKNHVEWLTRMIETWIPKLSKTGSIVINTGDAWEPGQPTISLYQERLLLALHDELGLHLCQRFQWENPSKLPSPAQYVTIERTRVKPSLETVWWLSPTPNPQASNLNVLTEYSDSMKKRIAAGGEKGANRPSGHQLAKGAFSVDHGGSIPGNLITAPNTESNSSYIRLCKQAGLPVHPARFPRALPEFFIKLLTDPGQLVADMLAGSYMTGEVAQSLGRRWFASEMMLQYALGGRLRFQA